MKDYKNETIESLTEIWGLALTEGLIKLNTEAMTAKDLPSLIKHCVTIAPFIHDMIHEVTKCLNYVQDLHVKISDEMNAKNPNQTTYLNVEERDRLWVIAQYDWPYVILEDFVEERIFPDISDEHALEIIAWGEEVNAAQLALMLDHLAIRKEKD